MLFCPPILVIHVELGPPKADKAVSTTQNGSAVCALKYSVAPLVGLALPLNSFQVNMLRGTSQPPPPLRAAPRNTHVLLAVLRLLIAGKLQ